MTLTATKNWLEHSKEGLLRVWVGGEHPDDGGVMETQIQKIRVRGDIFGQGVGERGLS